MLYGLSPVAPAHVVRALVKGPVRRAYIGIVGGGGRHAPARVTDPTGCVRPLEAVVLYPTLASIGHIPTCRRDQGSEVRSTSVPR